MKKLILIFAVMLTSVYVYAATAQSIISGLEKIKTYSADFVQTTEIEGFGEDTYTGKLYIVSGSKALWDYKKPYWQYYLFSTEQMQYFDSGTKQLVKQKLDPSTNVFMRLMLKPSDISKDFDVTLKGDKLQLKPKGDLGLSEIVFTVKNGRITGISTLDQNGNNTKVELKDIQVDKPIDKSVFTPEIPKDTEVFNY